MPTLNFGDIAAYAILTVFGMLIVLEVRGKRKRQGSNRPKHTQMESTAPIVVDEPAAKIASPKTQPRQNSFDVLTEREHEVATLAASGMSNKEIALRMSVSPHTVANHLKNVFRKLRVNSRGELSQRLQHLAGLGD